MLVRATVNVPVTLDLEVDASSLEEALAKINNGDVDTSEMDQADWDLLEHANWSPSHIEEVK